MNKIALIMDLLERGNYLNIVSTSKLEQIQRYILTLSLNLSSEEAARQTYKHFNLIKGR